MSFAPALGASPSGKGRIAAPYVNEADEYQWSGAYVGLGVGVLASISRVEDGNHFLGDAGAWGWVGDAKVGYDLRLPSTPFVIGLFGGYSLGSAEITGGGGGSGEHMSLTPTWNVGVRGGLVSWNSSLVYVGYKYNQADVSVEDGPGTIGGHTILGGIEIPASKSVTVGLEYGYTRWDDFCLNSCGASDLRFEPEDHRVMLRANLRFGGLGGN